MSTAIEKQNLEAHVELCAERYKNLEDKLDNLDSKVSDLDMVINEIKSLIHNMNNNRNTQLLSWGTGIVCGLLAIVGVLINHYML